jgi:hypothetical protein
MARQFFYVAAGICLLALAYHAGAATAGAQSDEIHDYIMTRSLVIVGEDGHPRIGLKSIGGYSALQFYDKNQKIRVSLQLAAAANGTTGSVALCDETGDSRVALGYFEGSGLESGSLIMSDKNKNERFTALFAGEKEVIKAEDSSGKTIWEPKPWSAK